MKLKHKKLLKNYIISGMLLAVILTFIGLRNIPYIAEYVFSRGISRAYIYVACHITAWFRFSVFEILCGVFILYMIFFIVRQIILYRKRRFSQMAKSLSILMIIIMSVLVVYTSTASFSYKRQSLTTELPQYQSILDKSQLLAMAEFFVEDFNQLSASFDRDDRGNIIPPHNFNQLSDKLREDYAVLDNNDYFSSYTPKAKKVIASDIMSLFGIIGISFQPTGEANINTNTPLIYLPQLMAHEFAHSKGIMRESDAELLSAYITLTSTDNYIRYSGYASYIGQILQMLSLNDMSDEYRTLYHKLDKKISIELANARQDYDKYSTFIEDIGTFFNNLYLKLSGIKSGVDSYYTPGKVIVVPDTGGNTVKKVVYSPIQLLIQELYMSNNKTI